MIELAMRLKKGASCPPLHELPASITPDTPQTGTNKLLKFVADPATKLSGICVVGFTSDYIEVCFEVNGSMNFTLTLECLDQVLTEDGEVEWKISSANLPAKAAIQDWLKPQSGDQWVQTLLNIMDHVLIWARRREALQKLQEAMKEEIGAVTFDSSRSHVRLFLCLKKSLVGYVELWFEDPTLPCPTRLKLFGTNTVLIKEWHLASDINWSLGPWTLIDSLWTRTTSLIKKSLTQMTLKSDPHHSDTTQISGVQITTPPLLLPTAARDPVEPSSCSQPITRAERTHLQKMLDESSSKRVVRPYMPKLKHSTSWRTRNHSFLTGTKLALSANK